MTCCGHTIDGQAPVDKIWVARQSVAGLGNPIDLSWTAPTWVKLVQIEANWDAVPTTSEFITVWKNRTGALYDVTVRAIDPSTGAANIMDWFCNLCAIFEPGDVIEVDYANTDGNTVGVQIFMQRIPQ